MKIKLFNKEIEIDESNKGIEFFLKSLGEPIDEVCTVYRYHLRKMEIDDDYTIEQAADELRKMNITELTKCVLSNIYDALSQEEFSEEYAQYVRLSDK